MSAEKIGVRDKVLFFTVIMKCSLINFHTASGGKMKAVESNEAAMEEDIDAEEEIKMAERL